MDTTYKNLNLSIYPLANDINNLELSTGENILPIRLLNPELLSFFNNNNIILDKEFKIIKKTFANTLNKAKTDGNYANVAVKDISPRTVAINWNFTYNLGTKFKFYTTDGATPTYNVIDTEWDNVSVVACPDWTTFGPILLNPQLPNIPKNDTNLENNLLILSLSFGDSWETINTKLANVIIDSTNTTANTIHPMDDANTTGYIPPYQPI